MQVARDSAAFGFDRARSQVAQQKDVFERRPEMPDNLLEPAQITGNRRRPLEEPLRFTRAWTCPIRSTRPAGRPPASIVTASSVRAPNSSRVESAAAWRSYGMAGRCGGPSRSRRPRHSVRIPSIGKFRSESVRKVSDAGKRKRFRAARFVFARDESSRRTGARVRRRESPGRLVRIGTPRRVRPEPGEWIRPIRGRTASSPVIFSRNCWRSRCSRSRAPRKPMPRPESVPSPMASQCHTLCQRNESLAASRRMSPAAATLTNASIARVAPSRGECKNREEKQKPERRNRRREEKKYRERYEIGHQRDGEVHFAREALMQPDGQCDQQINREKDRGDRAGARLRHFEQVHQRKSHENGSSQGDLAVQIQAFSAIERHCGGNDSL